MEAPDLENYLQQLGQELSSHNITKPIRVLLIGGAFMILCAHMQRNTDDVDIFWLTEDEEPNLAHHNLSNAVEAVANANQLDTDWFNYMTHLLMYDEIILPNNKLWKQYGLLHIYIPPDEFILALKIYAGRPKDLTDCEVLLPQTKFKTRKQAQRLLERYILPRYIEVHAETIQNSLDFLFKKS